MREKLAIFLSGWKIGRSILPVYNHWLDSTWVKAFNGIMWLNASCGKVWYKTNTDLEGKQMFGLYK